MTTTTTNMNGVGKGFLYVRTGDRLLGINLEDCISSSPPPEVVWEKLMMGLYPRIPAVTGGFDAKFEVEVDDQHLIRFGAVIWKGAIHVVGGEFLNLSKRGRSFLSNWQKSPNVYLVLDEEEGDPETKILRFSYLHHMKMKGPKGAAIAVAIDGKLYALAGQPTEPPLFEVWEPDDEIWKPLSPPPFLSGRGNCVENMVTGSFVIGKRLYVYNFENRLYYFDIANNQWIQNEALLAGFRSGGGLPYQGQYTEFNGHRLFFGFGSGLGSTEVTPIVHLLSDDDDDDDHRMLCFQDLSDLFAKEVFGVDILSEEIQYFEMLKSQAYFVDAGNGRICAVLGLKDYDRSLVCVSVIQIHSITLPADHHPCVAETSPPPHKRFKVDVDEREFLGYSVIGHKAFNLSRQTRLPSLRGAVFL